jgi:ATP-dependent Lhr-like helicase
MPPDEDPLASFAPVVRLWFLERYGRPTAVQAAAWPRIARGEHVVAGAPTGSGKTLTAFLNAISRFALGELPAEGLSVLYVSPLKALNEDLRLNLLEPLREIAARAAKDGQAFPRIRVATRSGDTSQAERRGMHADPPNVLCTTPESLFILLSSKAGLGLLSGIKLFILDELHALLPTRRGAALACSMGRLALLAGEYQRVGLSATVADYEATAAYLGAYRLIRTGGEASGVDGRADEGALADADAERCLASYEPRPVSIVAPPAEKVYELAVVWPPAAIRVAAPGAPRGEAFGDGPAPASRYDAVVRDLAARLKGERGVIAFADSRRRAERIAALLNEQAGEGTAWAHHGSLAKDLRRAVERRLKEGSLPCVVATSSLELGIDVGTVSLVALAGAPARADQALQRLGRAGHAVGAASRGVLYPFHGSDLLASAAVALAVRDRAVDYALSPEAPLDVAAQAILSIVLFEAKHPDELFDELRSCATYRNLAREDFDAVLAMLAGRAPRRAGSRARAGEPSRAAIFSSTAGDASLSPDGAMPGDGKAEADAAAPVPSVRVKELKARIHIDEAAGTICAAPGAAMLLYGSGGAIPDRGYYAMRLAGSGAKIGELDEEFVFERRVGNSFSMGAQAWRITAISDEAVEVAPLERAADFMPFWKAERAARGAGVALRMLELCAAFEADPEAFAARLRSEAGFDAAASEELNRFLASQRRAQAGAGLPTPERAVVELYRDPERRQDAVVAFVHTLRGQAVNEPLAIALAAELGERLGLGVERLANDDTIYLLLPVRDSDEARRLMLDALRRGLSGERLAKRLREGLEAGAAFGAAFRECAGRALLLPRAGFGKRSPLWITRLRAKRLYERVKDYAEFPIVKESWKSLFTERYDLARLGEFVSGMAEGRIEIGAFESAAPSPLAKGSGWAETNRFLYEGDELRGGGSAFARSWGDKALAEALGDARLRPAVPAAFYQGFAKRLRREEPGWAPGDLGALLDWVDERVAIPRDEWEALLACVDPAVAALAAAELDGSSAAARLVAVRLGEAGRELICRPSRAKELKEDPSDLIADWLAGAGIAILSRIGEDFGLSSEELEGLDEELVASGRAVSDEDGFGLYPGDRSICDATVYDHLLRSLRASRRPALKPRPAGSFAPFAAALHGMGLAAASGDPSASLVSAVSASAVSASASPAGSFPAGAAPAMSAARDPSLASALDRLSGLGFPPETLEREILPARLRGYAPAALDGLVASGEYLWFMRGNAVAICPASDWQYFYKGAVSKLLGMDDSPADFWDLKDRLLAERSRGGIAPADGEASIDGLVRVLWREAEAGLVSADLFEPLRRWAAGAAGPKSAAGASPAARGGRAARIPAAIRSRWKAGAPVAGRWFSLALSPVGGDELDELDAACECARMAAKRYGVLARALLQREAPELRWAALFPALRRMELSGELIAGRFFEELEGPQFISAEAFELFKSGAEAHAPWWVGALDPVSPAGLEIVDRDLAYGPLPARAKGSLLGFAGPRLVWVAGPSAKELWIGLAPDAAALPELLAPLSEAKRRALATPSYGEARLNVESINGESAALSPYADALKFLGFEADRGRLRLW